MKIVMMGTGTFAEPTFQTLLDSPHQIVGLVTQPDRVTGQERGSTRQIGKGMKAMAQERDVPVLQPESINTPPGVAALRAFAPELLVVAAYGQILSNDVLQAASQGGINVHGSLLPKYRGAAPVAWAIYHGEKQTGVTIIRMTIGLDAGDMLAQESIDVGANETAGELETRLAPLGARLALRVIDQIASNTTHGIKQDKTAVTRAPKLKKEDGLIDWSRTGPQVGQQIRAMQPWPTAYTFLHHGGKAPLRVIVTRSGRAMVLPGNAPEARHGALVSMTGENGLFVATGERGLIEILELQPAGKRRMSAADFLRGHKPQPDDVFGAEVS
jgi:methionyl-tRNA formyltransferase